MAETVDEIIEKSKYASQLEALLMMLKGENVFLCGPPGSGKSYVIKKFVKIKKMIRPKTRIETTSTTGISAISIGGKTIHSITGMGVSKLNFKDKLADYDFDSNRKLNKIEKADVIIIDEISMLSEWGLQYLYDVLDYLHRIGKVQIIVSGDFSQLPPVATRFDPPEMARICYNSQPWKDFHLKSVFLDRVYRTSDEKLKSILDNIALGEAIPEDLEGIKTIDSVDKTRRPILVSTNREVDSINRKKQSLNKEKKKYKFRLELPDLSNSTQKMIDASKRFVKAMSMPDEIVLKKNDTIMITANDSTVASFAKPILEEGDNRIFPLLKNGMIGIVWDISPNKLIFAYQDPKTMGIYKYEILDKVRFEQKIIIKDKKTKQKKEITIAWFKQIPVKLAYAISIHKSQGQTYSHLVCDLSNCWAENLGYVALSRAESLNGISIVNNPYGPNISEKALKCSQESIEVKKDILSKSYFGSNEERFVNIYDELNKYDENIRKELIDEEEH